MRTSVKILLLFCLFLNSVFLRSQTCASPIVVSVNNGFMGPDSFPNSSTRFLKFTANNFRTTIKLYIKNYNPSVNVVNIYNNDCANLAANKLNQSGVDPRVDSFPINVYGDSLEIVSTNFRNGNQYLIEIGISPSNPSTYTKYNVRVDGSTASLGCPFTVGSCPSYTCDLVCNGSFEDIGANTITYYSQLYKSAGWDKATAGTPDLYSAGASYVDCGVPCNVDGYRANITTSCTVRNNYALIINGLDPNNNMYNEYIMTRLKTPMVMNQSYIISLYVSKGDNCSGSLNKLSYWLTSNNIQDLSTQTTLTVTPSGTLNNPTILNSTSWNKISFCYTATGGEEYLTIGMPNTSGAWNSNSNISVSNCATFVNPPVAGRTGISHMLMIDEVSVTPFIANAGSNQTVTPCGVVNLSGSAITCGTISISPLTYSWSTGATLLSASQTATAFVNATTTNSIFTFYAAGVGTDGSTCINGNAITVISTTPVPLVITPSANSVCPGTNVTLTASAGVGTYTWLPGNSNSNPLVVAPTSNTTYTLIGNTSGGCTITKTITIYTYTDVITVSSSTSAICVGNTATLSASGGSGYTWQPGSLSGSPVNVSPGSTTILYCYGNYNRT